MASSVSVVVLSYNRPSYLQRALASVAAQSHRPEEVIVIDNRSPASEEIATLLRRWPTCELVRSPTNLGFAGGMNLGMARTSHPFVFVTEDDVILEPDCLARLVEQAEREPATGLLSGIMIDDERGTILSAGGSVVLGRVYRQDIIARGEPDTGQLTEPYDVAYVPGAMIFAARELWRRLGGFREDFFVYGEDVDLCLRARRAGCRITIVPAARVRHLPAPGPPSAVVEYHKLKNFLALYLLHASWRVLPEFLARYVVLDLVRGAGPGRRRLLGRALAWNARHLVALLRDRGRIRPAAATLR